MREILFGGKRFDNGKWVFGNFIEYTFEGDNESPVCVIQEKQMSPLHDVDIECCPANIEELQEFLWVDYRRWYVIPETVGQFAGRVDKNGNKIFEGNICKGSWDTVVQVYFDEDYAQFRAKTASGFSQSMDFFGDLEVIGNIHDNPELVDTPAAP